MATKKKLLQAAAGNATGGADLNVEEVFSTYLYEGTGDSNTNTIVNNIDLAGEGGFVWTKSRTNTYNNTVGDTESGTGLYLYTNTTVGHTDATDAYISSFNSDGYKIGSTSGGFSANELNASGQDYASWTFRKAPKFFDIVTYTGTGSPQTISHNLGSAPGFYIVKATSQGSHWAVYHNGTGTQRLRLNTTEAADESGFWATAPTSTDFSVSNPDVNTLGSTYIAYLFAHNDGDGGFGPDGDADIIKCGSYAGNGTDAQTIDLGFEAQWVMVKRSNGASDWHIFDNMRGLPARQVPSIYLEANTTNAEATTGQFFGDNQGFMVDAGDFNSSGENYIYMAIRRGTKVPESATEVFEAATRTAGLPSFKAPFAVDMGLVRKGITAAGGVYNASRLTGTKFLYTNGTDAEANDNGFVWDFMDGWANDGGASSGVISWMWKRAPGFFDVVTYTGTGVARTVSHNLGVAPEMMWVKRRNTARPWAIYHYALGNEGIIRFDDADAGTGNTTWNSTDPSAVEFTLGTQNTVNGASDTYIAYLFASLDGISKVGSYTGTGTNQTIDCGFTSGARFVLVKRSSNLTGDWFVWDTTRGIGAGNDPYISLNDTYAEVTNTDRIDPHSSGFIVTAESTAINASGVTYIFYAIA